MGWRVCHLVQLSKLSSWPQLGTRSRASQKDATTHSSYFCSSSPFSDEDRSAGRLLNEPFLDKGAESQREDNDFPSRLTLQSTPLSQLTTTDRETALLQSLDLDYGCDGLERRDTIDVGKLDAGVVAAHPPDARGVAQLRMPSGSRHISWSFSAHDHTVDAVADDGEHVSSKSKNCRKHRQRK
eukprot:3433314-Rhodomonas_salina.1